MTIEQLWRKIKQRENVNFSGMTIKNTSRYVVIRCTKSSVETRYKPAIQFSNFFSLLKNHKCETKIARLRFHVNEFL